MNIDDITQSAINPMEQVRVGMGNLRDIMDIIEEYDNQEEEE
jgi:hypothetical protein